MDDRPADLESLAGDLGHPRETLARELAELAEQLDEPEYEAFWEEAEARRLRKSSAPVKRKPK